MLEHEGRSHALLRPGQAPDRGPEVAQARHARRQLVEAIEHGIALMEVLGLPRLVTADFAPIDPAAAAGAIEEAIAALDAVDAPGEDLEEGGDAEPSLGWPPRMFQGFLAQGGTTDLELDTADWEPSLASPERHPQVPADPAEGRVTDLSPNARQTDWAAGARHDGEAVNEDGDELDAGEVDTSDDEPSLGRPEAIDQRARNCGRTADAELDPLDAIETSGPGPGLRRAERFALTERARAMKRRSAARSCFSTTALQHHSTGAPAHV